MLKNVHTFCKIKVKMVILLYLSRGIERTYLGGQGEVQMVEWFILKGSLCLTSNLIFLVISWRNANYRIYLNQIRSQSYKNTSCTRFDRELVPGQQFFVLCMIYIMDLSSLLVLYRLSLACFVIARFRANSKMVNLIIKTILGIKKI